MYKNEIPNQFIKDTAAIATEACSLGHSLDDPSQKLSLQSFIIIC